MSATNGEWKDASEKGDEESDEEGPEEDLALVGGFSWGFHDAGYVTKIIYHFYPNGKPILLPNGSQEKHEEIVLVGAGTGTTGPWSKSGFEWGKKLPPDAARIRDGKMLVFRIPSTSGGELNEKYVKQAGLSKLRLGVPLPIEVLATEKKFLLGETQGYPPPKMGPVTSRMLAALDLPAPAFVLAEEEIPEGEPPFYRTLKAGQAKGGGFSIDIYAVVFPKFPDFVPENAKKNGVRPYRLGEVETTWKNKEWVRIHLGRGKEDQNQVAWIGTAPDGFGPLRLYGSPKEFEAIYDDDPESYTDSHRGPLSYEVDPPLTEAEKMLYQRAGFSGHVPYIHRWMAPRLRQVKGGDILADIECINNTLYRKRIRLYWAKDVSKAGKFYSVSGTPFKTIDIINPTVASGNSLATD